jgi:hypothetical protein
VGDSEANKAFVSDPISPLRWVASVSPLVDAETRAVPSHRLRSDQDLRQLAAAAPAAGEVPYLSKRELAAMLAD